jgi:hypothetical protein
MDFIKAHRRFVELNAQAAIPSARFTVCDTGDGIKMLGKQPHELGVAECFKLRGYFGDFGAAMSYARAALP